MLKLVAKIPLKWLYGLSNVGYLVLYYLARYRRKVVSENLAKAFPERSAEERKKIEKDFYRNLTDAMFELIKAENMSEGDLCGRVRYVNPEVLQPFFESGQSIILLSAHTCNWEWLLLTQGINLPIPMDVVYKPIHDQDVDKGIFATRARFGVDPIEMGNFAREVIKRKGSQRAYGILADQRPGSKAKSYETLFLNQKTRFFVGPETIAEFVKIPVIYVHMKRVKRGYYEVEYQVLAQPPYKANKDKYPITESYVRVLEKHIMDCPENWLWSHRRWRNRKQERRSADLEKNY